MMGRTDIIGVLREKIERLASMHITYRLEETEQFAEQKEEIARLVRENKICVKKELDPLTRHLYNRYFS